MRDRFCSAWSGSAILTGFAALGAVAVWAALPATQPAPNFLPSTNPTTIPSKPAASITDEQIDASITRGVDFLLSNFDKLELKHLDGELGEIDHDGINDLCVYSLLKAGESIHDSRLGAESPFAKGALDRLKHQRLDSNPADATPVVYARAMRAAALAVYHRRPDHKALADDVDWLIHAQRDGAYLEDDQYEITSLHPQSPGVEIVPTPGRSPY